MTPEDIARRCEESCALQGVPVALDDPVLISRIVSVFRPYVARVRQADTRAPEASHVA